MGIHKNAPLTPAGRETLVRRVLDDGHTPMAVATAMAPQSVAILKALPESGLLFTNTGDTPLSGFSKAKGRIDSWIAEERRKAGKSPMPEWTLHDLRRTMVTMMNEQLAIPPHVVEACVNHVSGSAKAGVAGVYNKALYLEDRRKAMNAWDAYVKALLSKEQGESPQ